MSYVHILGFEGELYIYGIFWTYVKCVYCSLYMG